MELRARIEQTLRMHQEAVQGCIELHHVIIQRVGEVLAETFEAGGKVLACGNGGSACDAMHFAGECVGRFVSDRRPLPAIALTADPGILTAVGNDYGFEQIFERQVRAHGKAGDVLIGISTSGSSQNVLNALQAARELDMYTVLLTGEKAKDSLDAKQVIWVPSDVTAHIQECHIMVLQLLVALTEDKLLYNG